MSHTHIHMSLLSKKSEDVSIEVSTYESDISVREVIEDIILSQKNEDPFYIIDLAEIVKAFDKWTSLLPNIKPYYAIKCNTNPVILTLLSRLGTNFDCASENEIKNVLEFVSDPSRIVFANPCKMSSHIRYAKEKGVNMMTFDCEEELIKINQNHPKAKLLLRLAVDDSGSVCKFSKKFGCRLTEVRKILTVSKIMNLEVTGFSFHVGSGCTSASNFYEALRDCKIAVYIAKSLNITTKIIDIGGGFSGTDDKVAFKDIASSIDKGIADFFQKESSDIEFIAEPGRYFAEKSHTLVVNVISKKVKQNEKGEKLFIYYLNDGVYGSFNCIHFDHAKITLKPLNKKEGEPLHKSIVFGPTCDSIDLILENVMLPELDVGEWLYVESFGAYTVVASSNFNGFKTDINKYIYRKTNDTFYSNPSIK